MYPLWTTLAAKASHDWYSHWETMLARVHTSASWRADASPGYVMLMRGVITEVGPLLDGLRDSAFSEIDRCNELIAFEDPAAAAKCILDGLRTPCVASILITCKKFRERSPAAPDFLDGVMSASIQSVNARIDPVEHIVEARIKSRRLAWERERKDESYRDRQESRAQTKFKVETAVAIFTVGSAIWSYIGHSFLPIVGGAVVALIFILGRWLNS